jgi:hypothetical protein
MSLGQKGARLQAPVFALAHDALHVLLRDLEIPQQNPLELIGPIRILRHLLDPVQRHREVPLPDRVAKRCRPSKIAMG